MMVALLHILFSFFQNGLICFVVVRFLNRIIGNRLVDNKVYYFVCIVGVIFTTVVNKLNLTSFNMDLTAGSTVVFFLLFLYKASIWVKLMYGALFSVLAGVSQLITVMLVSIIANYSLSELYEKPFAFIGMTVLAIALLWNLCEIIVKIRKNKVNEMPASTSMFLITIPVASIIMLVIMFSWYLESDSQTFASMTMSLSALVGILYINFVVFYILDKLAGLMKEQREKELLEKQVTMQSKHYQQLEEYQNEIRSIRHDMKNNLLTLNQMMREFGVEQTQSYLSSLIDTVTNVSKIVDTGNPGIDTVLNIKLDEAHHQGIEISTDIIIPQGIKLSFENSVVLFGNLLDNAIEACVRFHEKTINIKMNMVNGALYINITNPAQSNGLETTKPDKQNHGIGLKNVALLIKDFDGMMKIENEGNIFSIKLVLYGL
jgi:Signal transduction histidine kinase regulating citrate/malate metabolism